MYCKKCGYKINAGEKRCSDCGTIVSDIEYNGGFWGLVGEEEKKRNEPPLEETKECMNEVENTSESKRMDLCIERQIQEKALKRSSGDKLIGTIKVNTKIKEKFKGHLQLFIVALVGLLVICLIQTAQVSLISRKYKEIQLNYESLDRNYQNLNLQYNELNDQYDELNTRYYNLNSGYSELNILHRKLNTLYNKMNTLYEQMKNQFENPLNSNGEINNEGIEDETEKLNDLDNTSDNNAFES